MLSECVRIWLGTSFLLSPVSPPPKDGPFSLSFPCFSPKSPRSQDANLCTFINKFQAEKWTGSPTRQRCFAACAKIRPSDGAVMNCRFQTSNNIQQVHSLPVITSSPMLANLVPTSSAQCSPQSRVLSHAASLASGLALRSQPQLHLPAAGTQNALGRDGPPDFRRIARWNCELGAPHGTIGSHQTQREVAMVSRQRQRRGPHDR